MTTWDRDAVAREIVNAAVARLRRRFRNIDAQPKRHGSVFLDERRAARLEARSVANVARQNERRRLHVELRERLRAAPRRAVQS